MKAFENQSGPIAKAGGLARLTLLLLASMLLIAAFWHLMYGVSLITATAVVGEIGVMVTLAFICAWRWSR